jgi:probable phosphoglycerate mutase
VLIRHGESTWNHEHRIQGQLDPPLSDRGREQAARLALRLGVHRPEAVYASDLLRAIQTAEPIAAALGLPVHPDAGLREIFLGEWEGLHTTELTARFPEAWAAWTQEPNWDLVPGGEGAAAFEARVGRALDALLARHSHGEAVVVTHGGVIQLALHRIVGKPSRGLFPFRISNASITILEERNGRVIIAGVNDVSHLEEGAERPVGPG